MLISDFVRMGARPMTNMKIFYYGAASLLTLTFFARAQAEEIGSQSIQIINAKKRPVTCADFSRNNEGWENRAPILFIIPNYHPDTFSGSFLPAGVYKIEGTITFKLGALINGTDVAAQLDYYCHS
jgi:hypothetical protein